MKYVLGNTIHNNFILRSHEKYELISIGYSDKCCINYNLFQILQIINIIHWFYNPITAQLELSWDVV